MQVPAGSPAFGCLGAKANPLLHDTTKQVPVAPATAEWQPLTAWNRLQTALTAGGPAVVQAPQLFLSLL